MSPAQASLSLLPHPERSSRHNHHVRVLPREPFVENLAEIKYHQSSFVVVSPSVSMVCVLSHVSCLLQVRVIPFSDLSFNLEFDGYKLPHSFTPSIPSVWTSPFQFFMKPLVISLSLEIGSPEFLLSLSLSLSHSQILYTPLFS